MRGQVLQVASYRFRSTFARQWGGYLSLMLLVGLVGGVALGSIAAARRTQSAYPEFLAASDASDLFFSPFGTGGPTGANNSAHTVTTAELARLDDVEKVASNVGLLIARLEPDGAPDLAPVVQLSTGGTVDGLFFNQDRVGVVAGRMADPARADEFVADAQAARLLGMHVGESAEFGDYSLAETGAPGFGTPRVAPRVRFRATLVGIVVPDDEVVEDDVDAFQAEALFTPALTRRVAEYAVGSQFALRLVHGARDVPAVERELTALVPPGTVYEFHETSLIEARVERVMRPESIALAVFGGIAGLTALVLAGLAMARQMQAGQTDREVLRALGADTSTIALEGLVGALAAVVLGALLAAVIAIALSPLAPIGPVRPVYPSLGIAVDWTVIGFGALALFMVLAAIGAAISYRRASARSLRRTTRTTVHSSRVVKAVSVLGLPTSGVVGVRLALEPGAGRNAVPVRSAMIGAVVAVVTVVATLTFGSGLHTLVSKPRLYGWNWSYMIYPGNQNVPQQTIGRLERDPDVAAASGVSPEQAKIDGQEVPVLLASSNANPAPPVLSGHGLEGANEIVLGAATMQQLHKRVGDDVRLSFGTRQNAPIYVPPTSLKIVGTATLPAIGYPSSVADHTSMGTGAEVATGVEPPALRQAETNPDPLLNGPSMVLVRLRDGVGAGAGRANLEQVVAATNRQLAADPHAAGDSVALLGVQRPAEIINYQSIGATPVILAAGLALGAVVALGLTLAASARRRRRDLALLKALGFTQGQLVAAVAWQATVAAVVGVVIGVPVGVAIGRLLWTLFAREIYAVPEPTVPVLSLVLVGLGAIVLVNFVAAIAGRIAARTPSALVLRAE